MRTTVLCLFLALFLLMNTQCVATRTFSVQIKGEDISNNLNLEAVASIFGEARNLEEFERKLNDPDYRISNLDLNNDGAVDYLRVIESNENNVHLIVIQAVLDRNIFQDIATIVVEKTGYRNATVQIVGDPYIYGPNYVIDPVFNYPPAILSFFWGNNYIRWSSPYYWGYYPGYYHTRTPYSINIYRSNIHSHINHNHRYNRADRIRYENYERMHNSVRRNDYGDRHPETNYQNRRQSPQINERSGSRYPQTAPSYPRESDRRSSTPYYGPGRGANTPMQNNTRSTSPTERSSDRPTATPPSNQNSRGASPVERSSDRTTTTPPTNQNSRGSRNSTPSTESSRRSSESQPSRTPDTRKEESRPSEERSGREGSGRR
jgi:hypothetical protein